MGSASQLKTATKTLQDKENNDLEEESETRYEEEASKWQDEVPQQKLVT